MSMKSGSIDPRKAALVAEFLKAAFPGHTVYDAEEFDRDCQVYGVDDASTGGVRHRVRVSREFLDDHTEEQITQRLTNWDVPSAVRRAGARSVLITNTGCVVKTEQER